MLSRNTVSFANFQSSTCITQLASGHATPATRPLPIVEALETRSLFSAQPFAVNEVAMPTGGLELHVTGTYFGERLDVTQSGDALTLQSGDWIQTFSKSYKSLFVDCLGGNDIVMLDASVVVPATLKGGAGNDSLTGGSGNDRLYGGTGTNYLYGAGGDDILVTIGGGANDRLQGGSGEDEFWCDSGSKEVIADPSAEESHETIHRVGAFFDSRTTVQKKAKASSSKVVKATKELVGQNLVDPNVTKDAVGYKNFAGLPLFADGGPSLTDIRQGQVGDCYFLSVLASVAKIKPAYLQTVMVDLGDGTYAVEFQKSNAPVYIRVDADLPVTSSGQLAYAAQGAQQSLWVAVMEKAWAAFRTGSGTYASIDGGWMDESYAALGMTSVSTMSGGGQAILSGIAGALAAGQSVAFAVDSPSAGSNLVGLHAYTVDRVNYGIDGTPVSLRLRNPWGVDGYSSNDGMNDSFVTVSADQVAKSMLGFTVGSFA